MADKKVELKKVTAEEAADLDRAKMGRSMVQKPEADVQGQAYAGMLQVQCPWCGNFFWIEYDDTFYYWYSCPWCGNASRH